MHKLTISTQPKTLADYLEHTLHATRNLHVCIENCPVIDTLRYITTEDLIRELSTPPKDTIWHLRRLGFNPKLSGYRCLLASIPFVANNPAALMKEVYIQISKQCGYSDDRCMEHTIRTAIHDAWERRDPQIWAQYFPTNQDGDVEKPTVKQFISRLAEELE